MKKHTRSLLITSALALFLSAAIGLNAQTTSSAQPPDTQAQQPSTPDQTTPPTQDQTTPKQTPEKAGQAAPDANGAQPAGAQSFSGTVVKSGDKYVLQDESGTTYDTDHQDEMAKFDGKRVKVRGTLDSTGKMIHIQ
jgi:hypothetical protein